MLRPFRKPDGGTVPVDPSCMQQFGGQSGFKYFANIGGCGKPKTGKGLSPSVATPGRKSKYIARVFFIKMKSNR